MCRLLQSFCTCRYNFILYVFDVLLAGRYLHMFHIRKYILCIHLVRNGSLLTPFVPTSQISICLFIYNILTPHVRVSDDGVLNDFRITFLCQFESLCIFFCKVPTSMWPLVDIQTFLHYLYTCRVQPYIYGNYFSSKGNWLDPFRDC